MPEDAGAPAGKNSSSAAAILINGSAVGYYGPGNWEVTEKNGPGTDFLSRVCVEWEKKAMRAQSNGLRVVLLRTGLVLSDNGGVLPRMLLPFRLFAGGPVGSGRQWMSWIHLDDLLALIIFLLERQEAAGPFNATAPNPVTNKDFSRVAAAELKRPCRLPVPGIFLRLLLGEMAELLLLNGQRALPAKALEMGFRFKFNHIEPALQSIL